MKQLHIINSRENEIIKQTSKLKIKKYSVRNNAFLCEGVRFVEEALMSGAKLKYCLCSESLHNDRVDVILKTMAKRDIDVYMIKGELMEQICDTESPQGIAAVIERVDYDTSKLYKKADFLVIADKIQDPGNLGTIIRTADAAGAQGVIVSEGTADPYSSKVLRSTMGSIFHLPVVQVPDIACAIEQMKSSGFKVYVTCIKDASPYYMVDYNGKIAIVIGNEANGVDKNIIQHADRLVKIPMPGHAESLNAAVAGGILMFEVVKTRLHIDK